MPLLALGIEEGRGRGLFHVCRGYERKAMFISDACKGAFMELSSNFYYIPYDAKF